MNFMSGVIVDDSLYADPEHLVLDIQIPWYRSLPLSCVAHLTVNVDGATVALDGARFAVNGHDYSLVELGEKTDEVWFIQDSARLTVPLDNGILAGDVHDVTVRLDTRIPYIIVGPGQALNNSVTVSRTLTARERIAA